MEDLEYSGKIDIGSGVILNCEDGRYIGFILAQDEMYLYVKTTHEWAEVEPVVTPESYEGLKAILWERPLWMLRAQVALRYRVIPLGIDKELAVSMLADWSKYELLDAQEPIETFVPQPKAVHMALAHGNILSFKSLKDVMGGNVLAGLDFTTTEEYNEEYGNRDSERGGIDQQEDNEP
jgi:hypothetical protein